MKYIGIFFIVIVSLLSLMIIGIDYSLYLIEKYSHFHIGRWKSIEKWEKAVCDKCKKWAIKTPALPLKKDIRYVIIDKINGSYEKKMVQSWQKAGCLLGVYTLDDHTKVFQQAKRELIADDGNWKLTIDKVDYAMLAYALLKEAEDKEKIRPAMNEMLELILNNIAEDGLITYSGGKAANRRYVDTLGFVCPFLTLYGVVYEKKEYISMAISQIEIFRKKGLLKGLPVHCYDAKSEYPLGIYGWGRGTGWYALALVDTYSELTDENMKKTVLAWMEELAIVCKKYILENGGFATILPAYNRYDSSATVMLGFFYAYYGKIISSNEYIEIAKRCKNCLCKLTKITGEIDECQGDTIDIGIFSERFGTMPFVQGMTVRLIDCLKKR